MRVALIDDGVVPQVVPRLPARNDLCVLEDGTIRQRMISFVTWRSMRSV